MPTIAEQLTQLEQDRDDLVDNLETKGITGLTGDETFTELVPEVLNIPSGGGDYNTKYGSETMTYESPTSYSSAIFKYITEIKEVNMPRLTIYTGMFAGLEKITYVPKLNLGKGSNSYANNMFYHCSKLTDITNLKDLDTSEVINMNSMFSLCSSLVTATPQLNTSKVTNMGSMFSGCSKLRNIDLSNFNTSNVTDMSSMFSGCSALTSVNLSSFNTSRVTTFNQMFIGCKALTKLDLSNFDFSSVNASSGTTAMFNGCTNLATVLLGGNTMLPMTNVNMITNCPAEFYVNDDLVETYKSATNWSTIVDRIHPISEYVEE